MRQFVRHRLFQFARRKLLSAFTLVCLGSTAAVEPRIDRIELVGPDQIAILFISEPYLTYELQVKGGHAITGPSRELWTSLYVARASPYLTLHVILDFRNQPHRFYRLRITPERFGRVAPTQGSAAVDAG